MKSTLKNIGLLFFTAIILTSCSPNEEETNSTSKIQNIAPSNGKLFSADEALQPLTFRWTPLVPKPQQSVTYRIKVWQLMQGQNSTEAMRTNQPIVTKDVDNVTETTVSGIYTGPCKPPYLCDFIWSVEAISLSNGAVTSTTVSNPTTFGF